MKESTHAVKSLLEDPDAKIKIEDLIPYFDDHIRISEFKEEICKSLTSYNEEIKKFKENMSKYSKNADFLKKEMFDLKNRYYIVSHDKECDFCKEPIFNSVFYYFPCSHSFHETCLQKMMQLEGEEEKYIRVKATEQDLKTFRDNARRQGSDQQ